MALSFIAVDVETAASRWDSICSIGLVRVIDGFICDEFYSLINPECSFDPMNIHINGIHPEMIIDAPTFGALSDFILDYIGDNMLVAHNMSFDGACISKSFARYGRKLTYTSTFCTYKYAQGLKNLDLIYPSSLKLTDLCVYYSLSLSHHHNALDDARACAQLLLAMANSVNASSFDDLYNIIHHTPKHITFKDKTPHYPINTTPIDLWALGDDLRKKGKLSEALDLFIQSKEAGNTAPALYTSIALTYHKMKNYTAELDIIDEFLSGKTYGRESEFMARKDRAVAALHAQKEAEDLQLEKERKKNEKKLYNAKVSTEVKPPRNVNRRAIIQMTDDGVIIMEYESIAAAVYTTGISSKSIRDAANGVQKHAGGFCWKYADQL